MKVRFWLPCVYEYLNIKQKKGNQNILKGKIRSVIHICFLLYLFNQVKVSLHPLYFIIKYKRDYHDRITKRRQCE